MCQSPFFALILIKFRLFKILFIKALSSSDDAKNADKSQMQIKLDRKTEGKVFGRIYFCILCNPLFVET